MSGVDGQFDELGVLAAALCDGEITPEQAARLEALAGRSEADYLSQWGSKLGGLPFHLYVYAGQAPGNDKLTAAGDELLRHVGGILDRVSPSAQLAAFALMSYAERVSPGSVYRTSEHALAPQQTSH